MKGYFITFEGGEGSGKSTIIEILKKQLEDLGYKVITTREPGGVKVSEEIREVILKKENKMSSETEALLYAASRSEHLFKKVIPYLEEGYIVLSDRYIDSSLAYQGYARGLGINAVLDINKFAAKYMPNRTYFIDIKPEVGLARIQGRSKIDRLDLEDITFHQRVYEGYLACAKLFPERILTVNGDDTIENIVKVISEDLLKVIHE